jgi:hypothetical protein
MMMLVATLLIVFGCGHQREINEFTKQDRGYLADAAFRSRQKLADCFTSYTDEFRQNTDFWEAPGLAGTGLERQFDVNDIH